MSNRDAYIKKMKAKLDEWSADIAKIEAKAKSAQADMEIQYNQKIDELKQQREKATAQLDELQNSGDEAWEDIKAGLDNAWESLGNAVNSALSRFK
jgi:DNA repair ATPase RecN